MIPPPPALLCFVPSPNFAPLYADRARRILVRGPNRIGKSRHIAHITASRAVAERIECRYVAPTSTHAHTVLGAYLADFLDPYLSDRSYYVRGRGWNGGRAKEIILRNGSVIQIRSLEDDVQAHSGTSQDLIVFDEPPLLAHYIENVARLMDRRGQLIIGATMVGRPIEFLRKEVEGAEHSPLAGRTEHASGWVQYVARLDREHCPWYGEDQIAEFVRTLASQPSEYAQRVEGAWEGVADDRHIFGFHDECVRTNPPPAKDYVVGVSFDHGELAGHSVALSAMFSRSLRKMFVLGAVANRWGESWENDAARVRDDLLRHQIPISRVRVAVGDINNIGRGMSEAGVAGVQVNRVLEAAFAKLAGTEAPPFHIAAPDKSPGTRDWGLRIINQALLKEDLLIHPSAELVLHALKYWRGKEGSKEYKRYIHVMDALRYLTAKFLADIEEYRTLRFG